MNGNKATMRVVTLMLALCVFLYGCSGKSTVNESNGHKKVGSTATNSPEEPGKTAFTTDMGKTENEYNTEHNDGFTVENFVFNAESPANGNATVTTENDLPDYGIELPDDNWD
jgi:hypothetical protein